MKVSLAEHFFCDPLVHEVGWPVNLIAHLRGVVTKCIFNTWTQVEPSRTVKGGGGEEGKIKQGCVDLLRRNSNNAQQVMSAREASCSLPLPKPLS